MKQYFKDRLKKYYGIDLDYELDVLYMKRGFTLLLYRILIIISLLLFLFGFRDIWVTIPLMSLALVLFICDRYYGRKIKKLENETYNKTYNLDN